MRKNDTLEDNYTQSINWPIHHNPRMFEIESTNDYKKCDRKSQPKSH